MTNKWPDGTPRSQGNVFDCGYKARAALAAAVSAAKDAEIAGLRAELLKSLADNAPLREQVRVLEDARPEPDCRTCASSCSMDGRAVCILPRKHCTNGDHYEPLPPVRLWRTA